MDSPASQGMTVGGDAYGSRSFAWRLKGKAESVKIKNFSIPQSGFRKGEGPGGGNLKGIIPFGFTPPGCLRPQSPNRSPGCLRPQGGAQGRVFGQELLFGEFAVFGDGGADELCFAARAVRAGCVSCRFGILAADHGI